MSNAYASWLVKEVQVIQGLLASRKQWKYITWASCVCVCVCVCVCERYENVRICTTFPISLGPDYWSWLCTNRSHPHLPLDPHTSHATRATRMHRRDVLSVRDAPAAADSNSAQTAIVIADAIALRPAGGQRAINNFSTSSPFTKLSAITMAGRLLTAFSSRSSLCSCNSSASPYRAYQLRGRRVMTAPST